MVGNRRGRCATKYTSAWPNRPTDRNTAPAPIRNKSLHTPNQWSTPRSFVPTAVYSVALHSIELKRPFKAPWSSPETSGNPEVSLIFPTNGLIKASLSFPSVTERRDRATDNNPTSIIFSGHYLFIRMERRAADGWIPLSKTAPAAFVTARRIFYPISENFSYSDHFLVRKRTFS